MPLKFSVVTSESDIQQCLLGFAKYVDVVLPMAYARQGFMTACHSDDGSLVGAYLIVTSPVFRTMVVTPQFVRENSLFFQNVSMHDCVEVNALWLSPEVTSKMEAISFWRKVVGDILKTNRLYLLLFYNSEIKALHRWYSYMSPTQVYVGPTEVLEGAKSHSSIFVGWVARANLRIALYKASIQMVKKYLSSNPRGGFAKKRGHTRGDLDGRSGQLSGGIQKISRQ